MPLHPEYSSVSCFTWAAKSHPNKLRGWHCCVQQATCGLYCWTTHRWISGYIPIHKRIAQPDLASVALRRQQEQAAEASAHATAAQKSAERLQEQAEAASRTAEEQDRHVQQLSSMIQQLQRAGEVKSSAASWQKRAADARRLVREISTATQAARCHPIGQQCPEHNMAAGYYGLKATLLLG